MQDSDCVFCKIVRGEIPSYRVHETPECFAFLDIGPLAPGHTLFIPKKHYQDIRDVPGNLLGAMMPELSKLAAALMSATGASGMNVLQNTGRSSGQVVFHLHFHLIPRTEGDSLGYRWNSGKYKESQAESLQSRIIDELQG